MQLREESSSLLSPGVIAVESAKMDDEEHFGPLLLVERANGLEEAIALANKTRFGLAADSLARAKKTISIFSSGFGLGS